MPAPWYRHARAACSSTCCVEASSLTLREGPETAVNTPATDPYFKPKDLPEPVNDVLEWLKRYDFRDESATDQAAPLELERSEDDVDECVDESTREETDVSPGKGGESPMQVPRRTGGSPMRFPGRVLQPGKLPKLPVPAQQAPQATSSCPCRPPPGLQGAAWFVAGCGCLEGASRHGRHPFEDEEEEWELRKQRSGTVGRLVVYHDGESPKDDIVLRGGGRYHVVVAGLREGGQAARVGVRAGDRLVSINGKKDFFGMSAVQVQERLSSPSILVFVGFVGKLQAEVRLARVDDAAGIPSRGKLVLGLEGKEFQLCEERVFDVGNASLFLTVAGHHSGDFVDYGGSLSARGRRGDLVPIFELQRCEATGLLKCAMGTLGPHAEEGEEEEYDDDTHQVPCPAPGIYQQTPTSAYQGPVVPTLTLPTNGAEMVGSFPPNFGATLRV
mmetsp:Transcript_5930/g.17732  ORF Transcript_5930/g.17732 Transcript_5930/m.17732 type:complete len:444 (-) Transcript_5930:78-1409(-)